MRYTAADAVRSHHWVPPVVTYAAFCAINLAGGGPAGPDALPALATTAAALFPISIWLTVVVGNCEDTVQAEITAAAVGGAVRALSAKLLVALSGAATIGTVATLITWAWSTNAKLADLGGLGAGELAQLLASAVGVGIGAWCIRPVLDRRAWVVLIGLCATMVEVLVPHCPPVRQFLVLFGEVKHPHLWAALGLISAESVLITATLVVGALRRGQSRV